MSISIICPLYNGKKYIKNMNESLLTQEINDIVDIKYILTETNDGSKELLDEIGASYDIVKADEFSHSYTREKAAYEANGDNII